jgi:hypothetical protein
VEVVEHVTRQSCPLEECRIWPVRWRPATNTRDTDTPRIVGEVITIGPTEHLPVFPRGPEAINCGACRATTASGTEEHEAIDEIFNFGVCSNPPGCHRRAFSLLTASSIGT